MRIPKIKIVDIFLNPCLGVSGQTRYIKVKKGLYVYWNDPDEDLSSGYYKVQRIINEEIIHIKKPLSEAEVHPNELCYVEI